MFIEILKEFFGFRPVKKTYLSQKDIYDKCQL